MSEEEFKKLKDEQKKKQGRLAESLAIKHFKNKGYKIISKNYETEKGEIDFIAKMKDLIVFVEVRSRTEPYFVDPGQTINKFKQKKLILTAKQFVQKFRSKKHSYRFDVVTVVFDENQTMKELAHIESAFIPNDLRGF